MTLPISRTVNVTVSRNDNFPSRRGFGTLLFLTSQAKAGKLDASHRTKLYGSMDEVAADFDAVDAFYKAANFAFSQRPKPLQIKAGWFDDGTSVATMTAADMMDELDAIYDVDQDFYFITVEALVRDQDAAQGVINWTEAQNKLALIDSNDDGHEDSADTTNISAVNKNIRERTGTFYHTDVAVYGAVALAAYMSGRNFDDANSAYTAKYKFLRGVAPLNIGSAAVTAITGFTPAVGQAANVGHMANTVVDIGGRPFVVEGSTLKANTFLDEIHFSDWLVARTEEAALGRLLNNARIPFTNAGMEMLAGAAREVMQTAFRAGLIADDNVDELGKPVPSVEYSVPNVLDLPESQRKARIAPAIAVTFRYAGAVHFTTINYFMTF